MPSFSIFSLRGHQVNGRRWFGLLHPVAWGMLLGVWSAAVPGAIAQEAILDEQVEFQPAQDAYTFTAEAGQGIIIEMVSEEFDPFITLLNPAGDILEQNDDYNDTLQASIVLEIPETGDYTVLAGSYYGQFGGNYRISVKPATDFQLVYDRALELMQSQDYGQAAEAYEAATVLVPNDPNSYLGRADALLRHQALLLGESFGGPNDLPPEIRVDIVANYEKAAQFYRANGNGDFAALILEQAEFVRTGEDPGALPPGEAIPDELIPDQVTLDEATPGDVTPDGATPGGVTLDELIPGGATPDEVTLDEAIPDEGTPGGATPDEPIPDEAIPDGAIPDEAIPGGAILDGAN